MIVLDRINLVALLTLLLAVQVSAEPNGALFDLGGTSSSERRYIWPRGRAYQKNRESVIPTTKPALGVDGGGTSFLRGKNIVDPLDCRNSNYLSPPRLVINRTKKVGNYFGNKYKVRGMVVGSCLVEAGYFENGFKQVIIPVITSSDFKKFEFEVEVKAEVALHPEIQVVNLSGNRVIFEIAPTMIGVEGRYVTK